MQRQLCLRCKSTVPVGSLVCLSCTSERSARPLDSRAWDGPASKSLYSGTGAWIGGSLVFLLVLTLVVFGLSGKGYANQATVVGTRQ